MKTYIFPGQGSQKKGMGKELFDEFPDLTKQADAILGYSIKDLCLSDPDQKLNQTQYTQPAMYVVNALSYLKRTRENGNAPDFLAGHSLGEYNALHAAGVFSFESGLKLVKKRGELMSKAKQGAMAAVIRLPEHRILEVLKDGGLTEIDIANLNSPSQTVISGLQEDIGKAQSLLEKEKAIYIPLNTSGAFHSRYMKEAETAYEKYIKKFKFAEPNIRVIANVTAKPYEQEEIVQNLIRQISSCVRWTESIRYLLDQGEMDFEELGVGDVLTKLVAAIRKDWDASSRKIDALDDQKGAPADSGGSEAKAKASKEDAPLAQDSAGAKKESVWPKTWNKEQIDAREMVDLWNKHYPVGTRVTSNLYDSVLETRTEAMILFGHRAAIYMKGYNGYFDLREVTPAGE